MKIEKFVPEKLAQAAAKQMEKLEANSPHILFGLGIVGVLGGTVLACRATLKAEPILDEMCDDINAVKTDLADTPEYKKDLAYAYWRGSKQLVQTYALPVAVIGGSIALLTNSHIQMTRRNAALTAAYASLHQAYEAYRVRVRDEVGTERELELHRAIETVEGPNGTMVKVADPSKLSPYSRFFDKQSSTQWVNDAEHNRAFLLAQQNYYNDRLQMYGHVFLNEVYDALGMRRTNVGQHVGWKIDGEDQYIDFGVFEARNARFVLGDEHSLLLDFNVDGLIEI